MIPSIVCGIDASTHAEAALRVASALADRLRLRLVLIHAVPAPTPDLLLTAPARVPAHVEQIDLLGRDAGERLLSRAAESQGVRTVDRRLEHGCAAERLCAIAREEQARFVVIGSRGEGPVRAALLGSVSGAVARDSPCPVVVVPRATAGLPLQGKRIVCGVRGGEDRPAAVSAAWLSDRLGVPLTLTRVLPAGSEAATLVPAGALAATFEDRLKAAPRHALRTMGHSLKDAECDADPERYDVALGRGDPADQLLELAASAQAILLVVGSRGLGLLRGGLFGSVSRELVRRATRPVVICRQEQPT